MFSSFSNNKIFKSFFFIVPFYFFQFATAQGNYPYVPYQENAEVSSTNQAQKPKKDTVIILPNTISFHPLLLVDGTVALGYERALPTKKHAVRVIIGRAGLDNVAFYDSRVKDLRQWFGEINVKFFLSRIKRTAPVGLYASPFFSYRSAFYNFELASTSYSKKPVLFENFHTESFSGGVMLGYTAIVLEMVTLEVYTGVGQQGVTGDYYFIHEDEKYKPLESGFQYNNGPLFKFGVSIGVNF